MGALVEIEPRSVAATPGVPAVAQIRLRNSGSVVDQFSLDVVGDAASWAAVEPATVSLFPGAEGTATVTFTAPRSPSVRAGRVPFGLRIQSKEDPAGSLVEEGSVEVAPFTEVTAELVPRTSRGSTGATHDLAVDNRGNVQLSAAVSAVDPDRLLNFDLRPAAVNAEPGTVAFSKVRVAPEKRFWRGASVTRPFNVQVALPDGAAPLTLDGSLLQTPILPRWTLRALLAAAGLLVALVLVWALLLKPAIESSARDQAEDVLAAVGITMPPSGAGGGGPSKAPGDSSASPGASTDASGSPDPSASSAPTSAPTAAASGVVAGDGRLVVGSTPVAPATGKTLYVTDLVFSNSDAAAQGELRLERGGEPLLILRLQNFRDLDYHFVTPIVVAEGQTLSLVCGGATPAGCPSAALYYSGFQR